MKIIVLNGSPKGITSVTMQYIRYMQWKFPQHEIKIINISQKHRKIERDENYFQEIIADVKSADGIIWAFPVYIYLVPSNYKRFIELIRERHAEDAFKDKYTIGLSTSKHFYDHTAHNYIHAICDDLNMRYVDFYSADMYDLNEEDKRKNFILFSEFFFEAIENEIHTSKSYLPVCQNVNAYLPDETKEKLSINNKKIVLLTDCEKEQSNLAGMIEKFRGIFIEEIELINLHDVDIKGPCLACIRCAYDNQCVYKDRDGYVEFYNTKLLNADIIVFAGAIKDRFLSSRWKLFLDRAFYFGHIPELWGKHFAFIVSGPLGQTFNIREIIYAYSEIHRSTLVDIITDEYEDSKEINRLLESLGKRLIKFAEKKFVRPYTTRGVGGAKIFRDMMFSEYRYPFIADHKFYKKHGFYDYKKPSFLQKFLSLLSMSKGFRKYVDKEMDNLQLLPLKKLFKEIDKQS